VRFRILDSVPASEVGDRLPQAFHPVVLPSDFASAWVTILQFPLGEAEVVHSRDVQHALAKRSHPEQALVAAGNNFTQDSRDELDAVGAVVLSLRDFYWTDERHDSVRQGR
jgi:hypothetical protein